MDDDSADNVQHFPRRPKHSGGEPFSHTAFAFQRIGKKYGRYLEVGVARLPPCPHCGQHYTGKAKAFLNRLPIGGFSGGLLFEATGTPPPQLKPDHPEQTEIAENELLPES